MFTRFAPRNALAAIIAASVSTPSCLAAQTRPASSLQSAQPVDSVARRDTVRLPGVSVVGTPDRAARIPGSVDRVDAAQLRASRVFSTNEALRKVPGLHVRDEEGFGLRPNIGVRGLNPTRSTKVLLLEDGIPFTIAPYGDNAAYYHPPIERMESIEVLKGSGQLRYGPQTIGGVINYLTPAIPGTPSASLSLAGGSRSYLNVHGRAGGTFGGAGVLADYIRRSGDGARANTNSVVDDASLKFLIPLEGSHSLAVRANLYREASQVTYSGLTEDEWRADPRQNPFVNDGFDISRIGAALTHRAGVRDERSVTTTLYGYRIGRDWWRQSSNSTQRPNDRSDPTCGGMANLTTSCGAEGRLRDYVVVGVEPRAALQVLRANTLLQLDVGARAHFETQERQQVNAALPTSRTLGPATNVNSGLVEDNRRTTEAYAAFVQARVMRGPMAVTGGLRGERLYLTRLNRRPVVDAPGGVSGATSLAALIPGIGATWTARERLTLFAGVHRGFAPPRPEDVISNSTGGVVELDAETSWNSEVGARWAPVERVSVEVTAFELDFGNQIVPASVAGGTGAALTSAGRTVHRGAELSVRAAASRAVAGMTPFTELAATWLPVARFEGDRFAYVGTAGSDVVGKVYAEQNAAGTRTRVSVAGNRLPYAPEGTLTATLGVRHGSGAELRVEAVAVSEQFGDPLNTRVLVADGQQGPLAGNVLWNLTVNMPVGRTGVSVWLAAKNVTDRVVVVDRTRGLLPGLPRLVQFGLAHGF
jgi:Fe(3+) dicitrate transport protein